MSMRINVIIYYVIIYYVKYLLKFVYYIINSFMDCHIYDKLLSLYVIYIT